MVSFYDFPTEPISCRACGWAGVGADARQGELFSELVEYDCPSCGDRVAIVLFPTREEAADAARRGVPEAVADLESFAKQDRRWRRVLESRTRLIVVPEELGVGDVRCQLTLEHDDDERWLVLSANGIELHRELAVWESTEPAHRLLAAMRDRFGDRLLRFDYGPAMLYLGGDRLSSIDELAAMVADLPEHDS